MGKGATSGRLFRLGDVSIIVSSPSSTYSGEGCGKEAALGTCSEELKSIGKSLALALPFSDELDGDAERVRVWLMLSGNCSTFLRDFLPPPCSSVTASLSGKESVLDAGLAFVLGRGLEGGFGGGESSTSMISFAFFVVRDVVAVDGLFGLEANDDPVRPIVRERPYVLLCLVDFLVHLKVSNGSSLSPLSSVDSTKVSFDDIFCFLFAGSPLVEAPGGFEPVFRGDTDVRRDDCRSKSSVFSPCCHPDPDPEGKLGI